MVTTEERSIWMAKNLDKLGNLGTAIAHELDRQSGWVLFKRFTRIQEIIQNCFQWQDALFGTHYWRAAFAISLHDPDAIPDPIYPTVKNVEERKMVIIELQKMAKNENMDPHLKKKTAEAMLTMKAAYTWQDAQRTVDTKTGKQCELRLKRIINTRNDLNLTRGNLGAKFHNEFHFFVKTGRQMTLSKAAAFEKRFYGIT